MTTTRFYDKIIARFPQGLDRNNATTERQVREAIERLRRCGILVLSESRRAGHWLAANRAELAEMQTRPNLVTVFATNTNPPDIPGELGCIASRMNSGVILSVPGPDMREALGLRARQEYGVVFT